MLKREAKKARPAHLSWISARDPLRAVVASPSWSQPWDFKDAAFRICGSSMILDALSKHKAWISNK